MRTRAALVMLLVGLFVGSITALAAPPEGRVCPLLDTGRISLEKFETPVIEFSVPDGAVILSYCVKAGSTNSGEGPRMVYLDEPYPSAVTIRHPSGKNISHYSVEWIWVTPTTTTTSTTVPESTTTTSTTVPESTTTTSTTTSTTTTTTWPPIDECESGGKYTDPSGVTFACEEGG